MTAQEIEALIIRALIASGYSDASPDMSVTAMGVDSLDGLEIVMAMEEFIGRDIPDEWWHDEYEDKTFSELAVLLAAKLAE